MSKNRNIAVDRASTYVLQQRLLNQQQDQPNWLGHRAGAAAIDTLLLTGATLEEMEFNRGAVREHLRHLEKEHGLNVVNIDGNFRFAPPVED